MRKPLIALAIAIPLLGLGGIAAATLPALAESGDDDSCVIAPAGPVAGSLAGPIDLEAIPAKPVTGRLSIRGAGGDCDDEGGDGPGRGHGDGGDDD